jgi:excisionase family DNA binding protein
MKPTCDISKKAWLTVEETCLLLGISRTTLSEMREKGQIAFYREKGDSKRPSVRFKRTDIDRYTELYYERYNSIEETKQILLSRRRKTKNIAI